MAKTYDTIIIGGGPSGLTAAIYCGRYLIKTLLISKDIGGQLLETMEIENYPGFEKISGMDLSNKMKAQAEKQGAEIKTETVKKIKKNKLFEIETDAGKHKAKTVILCLGSKRRQLNVKGEDDFKGRGVSYCATCDAAFFSKKTVAVVGSGNASAEAALLLAKFADNVTILIRKEKMKCEPVYLKKIEESEKITIKNKVNIKEINGTDVVTSVDLDNGENLELNGVFIEVGFLPDTTIAKDLKLDLDDRGYIKVNEKQESNISGLFAAGDITTASNHFAQITTATGEATIASESAYKHTQK